MKLLDPDPRFDRDRIAEECAESWQVWHDIARHALQRGDVTLAWSAVMHYGLDVDRITSS